MGKAKRQAQLCSSSYDTSGSSDLSDDEHPSLDAGRYQAANMQQGLRTRCATSRGSCICTGSCVNNWTGCTTLELTTYLVVLWQLLLLTRKSHD